jgi:uncharacterized membrane protein
MCLLYIKTRPVKILLKNINIKESWEMEQFHVWLDIACEIGTLMFEFVGVVILVLTGVVGVYNFIKKSPYTRLELAKGMALGLEFKMGGEILRTVGVTRWQDIAMVGGIILLRAALSFLIHWEIKTEEKECETLEDNVVEEEENGGK